jgi:hypothetical protein
VPQKVRPLTTTGSLKVRMPPVLARQPELKNPKADTRADSHDVPPEALGERKKKGIEAGKDASRRRNFGFERHHN